MSGDGDLGRHDWAVLAGLADAIHRLGDDPPDAAGLFDAALDEVYDGEQALTAALDEIKRRRNG